MTDTIEKAVDEFIQAVKEGDLARAKRLAEVDKSVVKGRGFAGATALHWAVQIGSVEAVRLVLELGAKVDRTDILKRTPLHWVVMDSSLEIDTRLEIAAILLGAGADPNAEDARGSVTPITAAVLAGDGLTQAFKGDNAMFALLKQFDRQ